LLLAHDLHLDIKEIIENKIQKTEKKYPVEKAFSSNKKYPSKKDWWLAIIVWGPCFLP
jgi:hypothetical protein